jgi:undecaprenyl diphosphate synthase|tara:strand:- start:13069 stop:13779 length:711 start_codon:yes stop_codon:yes gene_type:complete
MSGENIIPNHIAVIMDGNQRWARKRILPIKVGHKSGANAIKELIKSALELKISYITIYAFSTENWLRPSEEVEDLMILLQNYLANDVEELIKYGIKIVSSGDISKLGSQIENKIETTKERTKNNKNLTLNVAFNYGSRAEITKAVQSIAQNVKDNKIDIADIDENLISNNLYNPEIPDPDLIIRTGGYNRLSNFLLWQSSYSELYFTEILWPDFKKEHLKLSIQEFNKRKRNYGTR